MKYLLGLLGLVLSSILAVYIVAFTPFGNGLIKPILESKIQEKTQLNPTLSTFSLNMSEFNIVLELSETNKVNISGDYSLFSQTFNIKYNIEIQNLEELKSVTKGAYKGRVFTHGTIIGDAALTKIEGLSDIAKSDTSYFIELRDFNPTSIIATVSKAELLSLLTLGAQKPYANAEIDLNINFKNITPNALDGNILLQTYNGKLDTQLMKSDFNVSIPPASFTMKLDAQLQGDDIDYKYFVDSNLAKISSSGNINPQPLSLDVKYGIDIEELAVLKPITNADIRGPFKLEGRAKGTKEKLHLNGISDVAGSDTVFNLSMKDFQPKTFKAKIDNLKLQKLLYMIKQPHYTDGILSMDIDIKDARAKTLEGVVVSKITKGLVNSKYMTKEFEFKSAMPRTTYDMKAITKLKSSIIDTSLDFNSNLANFDIKQARFNTQESSIVSDYLLKVPSLDKMFFITGRNLRGGVSANGEFKKAKDLDLTIYSKIAGGEIDAKLHNDDFYAQLKSLQTLDLLDILMYPKVFKSTLNGVLEYNLLKAKGVFKADMSDGKFTRNQMLDLIKQFARTDLYKERFKGDMTAHINKENIVASLDLHSNKSSIKTKNTSLNSQTKKINSKLEINANGNPVTIILTGNASAPKVTIDAQKLIQKEVKKAVSKEINKLIEKETEKAVGKEINELLKGLF